MLVFSYSLPSLFKMFYVEDGVFYSGSAEDIYFIVNIISMLVFFVIIIKHSKELGFRDTIAVLPYSVIPLLSMTILKLTGLNIMVTMLAFCMLIMYVTVQSENENYLFTRLWI